MTIALPTLAGVRKAAKAIRPDVPETPLVRSEILSRALDADVWLKNETVNPVASFKLRGALAAVLHAGSDGVVTSSTGNHGQGVAYAARLAGLRADIFLPKTPNPMKKGMIAAFGATIHEVGYDLDDAKDHAKRCCAEHGHAFIDAGENLAVIEGAGTIGLEAAQALADIDAMIIPMGSGNLASGCAAALEGLQPRPRSTLFSRPPRRRWPRASTRKKPSSGRSRLSPTGWCAGCPPGSRSRRWRRWSTTPGRAARTLRAGASCWC